MLLQSTLAIVLIFSMNMDTILRSITFLLELVLLLTVWGVVHLRKFQPDLPRPYRAWGYPWTTILFLIMVGLTLGNILAGSPQDTRLGLGILGMGVAVYFVARPGKTE